MESQELSLLLHRFEYVLRRCIDIISKCSCLFSGIVLEDPSQEVAGQRQCFHTILIRHQEFHLSGVVLFLGSSLCAASNNWCDGKVD